MTAGMSAFGVFALLALAWLLRPWHWAAFKDLVTHPPLGPYMPRWWWVALLMRFGYLAWRTVLTVLVVFLSAVVSVNLAAVKRDADVQAWVNSGWMIVGGIVGVLLFGFAVQMAIYIWRITNTPEWPHRRRHLDDLMFPAGALGLVLVIGWLASSGLASA